MWRADDNKTAVVHLVLIHDHLVGEDEKFAYFDEETVKKEVCFSLQNICESVLRNRQANALVF